MRLLFFTNVFPSPLAATRGTFNGALVNALAELGPVHVVSPTAWVETLAARWRGRPVCPPGLVSWAPEVTARFPAYYYPPKLLRAHYGSFLDWSVRRVLDEDIARFQPQAIVSYWAHPDGEAALRAARRAGLPAISMVGGSDVLLLARSGARRRAILNVLQQSDAVVPVSAHIARCLEEDGIDASRLHVIRRGVDREIFRPGDRATARERLRLPPDRPVLIAVGRLVPVKGFDVLIEACRRLRSQGVSFSCHILGGGPLAASLRARIEAEDLGDVVHLPGPQPQSALADWYRAADLTVLSSHSEGVPNVLLESIASGTPFVASAVGGVPEIADPDCHRLVPPGDPAALAEAIAERLSSAGQPSSPRFQPMSWLDSARALRRVISHCLECPARNRGDNHHAHESPVTSLVTATAGSRQ